MTSELVIPSRISVQLYISQVQLVWPLLLDLAQVPEAVLVFQLWVDMFWSC